MPMEPSPESSSRIAVAQAVVLAAGRGRRMGALTDVTPKPLLEVDGRPILFHQLDALCALGVRRVVVVVGYRGERIVEAVDAARRDEDSWPGLEVSFVWQASPLGTAHALAAARLALDDLPFLLLLGDLVVSTATLARLVAAAGARGDVALGVDRQSDPSLGAAVAVDAAGLVRDIVEKPAPGACAGAWNNSGIYLLPPRALALAAAAPRSPRGEHELPDVVLALLAEGATVRAVEVAERLRHVGSPADLTAG
jgi:UDP-N-acetylglucosamine diphosphorylase / glucose-1-phosphate thymidylyltransferase / UDP-N-acetylgalactosamine diphosphorylase / glucosamine-1-phosphate N-acetyltransferase / galactosamine-1-phosphate N-acetyltransferase